MQRLTLVQWVIHKPTKEKRLIKANRFNPEIHKKIDGPEGEVKPKSRAGRSQSGIILPKGTKAPSVIPAKQETPPPATPADNAPDEDADDDADDDTDEDENNPPTFEELNSTNQKKVLKELGCTDEEIKKATNGELRQALFEKKTAEQPDAAGSADTEDDDDDDAEA